MYVWMYVCFLRFLTRAIQKYSIEVYYDSLYGGSVGLRQIFPPLSRSDFFIRKGSIKK